jgi:beta-RFAP synthase
MSNAITNVVAYSRLHCGMFSFGRPDVRRFGGVGLMIDRPGLELTVASAERFEATGGETERVSQCVERLVAAGWFTEPPACRIHVGRPPRAHAGLGSGTQLALAVAAGLTALVGAPPRDARQLAAATGRGQRSAIGLHGFARGGLLVEAGKQRRDELGPLVARADVPSRWRFLLITPPGSEGLSGEAERLAFDRLPAVPLETTERLCRLALLDMLPAVQAGDFEHFSEAYFQYGHLAGACFATEQGSAFASRRLAEIVGRVRAMGVGGIIQSSWGPTLAAVLADEHSANELAQALRGDSSTADLHLEIASPVNHGAIISGQQ